MFKAQSVTPIAIGTTKLNASLAIFFELSGKKVVSGLEQQVEPVNITGN